MPSPCDCCNGTCQYCVSMGYTWPKVTRITGQSKNNVRRHMLLHRCCKKQTKKAVVHPITNRPLIVDALPVELQARILLHFGENPPRFHPFPRPLESMFEVQVHLQVVLINDRMTMLLNRTKNKRMKHWQFTPSIMPMKPMYTHKNCQRYHYKYIYLILESQCEC